MRAKAVLFVVALFFLALSLARPQFGTTIEEAERRLIDGGIRELDDEPP